MNEWDRELFDPATTPALRATPPVPGGELVLLLLQFIHTFYDSASDLHECENSALIDRPYRNQRRD